MKPSVKLVVVIPVGPLGPKLHLHHVEDTVQSVIHYTSPERKIMVLDDSGTDQLGTKLQAKFPELVIFPAPLKEKGTMGGLYLALSAAYKYAYENFTFEVLLKMDTDALMIGHGLEDDAIAYFGNHPEIGQIGTYMIGCNGEISEFSWSSQQLLYETSLKGYLQNRPRCKLLRELRVKAESNGYQLGEHCLGGANFMSYACIERLYQENLLNPNALGKSILQEDHLFSLLVKSVGFHLGDFGTPTDPLAVRWQGMPDSPARMVERGKKLFHSTRFWQAMKEDEIREFFRLRRESVLA